MSTLNANRFDRAPQGHHEPGFVRQLIAHVRISIVATLVTAVIVSGIYPVIVWGLAQVLFHHQANGSLIRKDGSPTDSDADAVGSALLGQPFTVPAYFHPRPSAAGNGYDSTQSGGSNLGPMSDKLLNGLTTPATTQPTTQPESLGFDGVRLRTIHYAVDNGIAFKLFNVKPDGTRVEVPLSKFEDNQGNLNDVALVDAFPHPPSDTPDRVTLIADDFATPIPGDAVTMSASGLDPHISPDNASLQKARVAKARGINPEQVQQLIDENTDKPNLGLLGDPGVNVLTLNTALDAKYPLPAAPTTQPAAK
jgi:K+-transporting ATPase ATPase C chain